MKRDLKYLYKIKFITYSITYSVIFKLFKLRKYFSKNINDIL